MALSGVHLVFAYSGGTSVNRTSASLLANIQSSQTMATPTTSTILAAQNTSSGQPVARVRSSADIWVAFGSAPDATTGPRTFVAANTDYDFFVTNGDKMAWILA